MESFNIEIDFNYFRDNLNALPNFYKISNGNLDYLHEKNKLAMENYRDSMLKPNSFVKKGPSNAMLEKQKHFKEYWKNGTCGVVHKKELVDALNNLKK